MNLYTEISRRNIHELLHFTTNRGIVGVLAKGRLLSRHRLPEDQYLEHILKVNSKSRPEAHSQFDKSQNWLDYVNLSISEINRRYFDVSLNWHKDSDIWWGILSFDSELICHNGVFLTTTNNSYSPYCLRQTGIDGFNALFRDQIQRKHGWIVNRRDRPDHLPTCEQAEVLYPAEVSCEYLRRIYVREGDHYDQARGWLRDFEQSHVEVIVNPEKFVGHKN